MDVYSYDNVSNTTLSIGAYTIPIGGEVVSNGSEIAELEAKVGLGLEKYKNGVRQVFPVTVNSTGVYAGNQQQVFAAGLTEAEVALVGTNSSTGLRIAVIGASLEARAHPVWNFTSANYVRNNGVVTLTFDYVLADKYLLPGQKIRVGVGNTPSVEGVFSILSCTVTPSTSTTVTYADTRADVTAGGMGASSGQIQDLAAYSSAASWPTFLNLALGGKADIVVVATSGTNIVTDWGDERIQQVAAQGTFDCVVVGAGLLGNAVKVYGAGPAAIKTATLALIQRIQRILKPKTIFVETFSLARDVAVTDATYTAANVVNKWLWKDLQSKVGIGNVVVVPGGEAQVQNYSAYNAAPSTDIQNGWPEEISMNSDGVHQVYGGARVRGFALAEGMAPYLTRWVSPEMGAMPQTRQRATGVDVDGNAFPNWLGGLWGNVDSTKVTMTATGCTGVGPAASSMAFISGRGSSTAVSSLSTNPTGGADWGITINGAGSTSGYLFNAGYAPTELLTALNSAEVQGKTIMLLLPVTFSFIDSKLIYTSVELVATVGGQDYILNAPLSNQGQYQMAASLRAMDAGFSGVLKGPHFFVPVATYTAASLKFSIKEINGLVASGKTVFRMGPGLRMEVV